MELGAAVVREVAKMTAGRSPRRVYYDEAQGALAVQLPGGGGEFLLNPADVRRNDTSASAVDEWTGGRAPDIPDGIRPTAVNPLGNYAVQISWEDGFNQVAAFEMLEGLCGLAVARKPLAEAAVGAGATAGSGAVAVKIGGLDVAAHLT